MYDNGILLTFLYKNQTQKIFTVYIYLQLAIIALTK